MNFCTYGKRCIRMSRSKRAGVLTKPAHIRQLLAEANREEPDARPETTIQKVWFDRERDAIVATLSTGVTLAVPRSSVPPMDKVPADALADIAVDPWPYSCWSETADIGLLVETIEEYGVPLESLAAR